MAKDKTGLIGEILSDKSVEKIIACVKEYADKAIEQSERTENRKEQNLKEEKERVRKEFIRICDLLKKATPGTDKYDALADSLQHIKRILDFLYY